MKKNLAPVQSSARTRWLSRLALTSAASLMMGTTSFAAGITLQWDPVTAQDLTGYKVYYANSATGPFSGSGASEGPSPITISGRSSATITGLDPNVPHYFAVTAYNSAGVESPYSNILEVPELVPPTVSITSPTFDTTNSGTVSVTASASDNMAVAKVEFYVNGVLKSTDDAGAPYLYSWDTSSVDSGTYTLSAKAYDSAGNVGLSDNVTVKVVHDVVAPDVALTAPGNGSTLHGLVAFAATASDDIGVTKVEFYANGALLSVGNVTPYGYTWDTTSVENGAYTLYSKAYDAAGNVAQSPAVQVNVVNDSISPSVSIVTPSVNATAGGTVTVAADASDNIGVTRVDFYLNGALHSTTTTAPYTFTWNTLQSPNGSYSLTALAFDAMGNVGQSASVPVTVFNDTTAPSVSLAAPSTASGNVTVSAAASDDVGVTRVDFYLDGILKGSATAAPYGFNWDTSAAANGSHTLSAVAYDAAGNAGQSGQVSVAVFNDTTPPAVAIATTQSTSVSGTVQILASASDNVGVSRVEFYVDGALQSTSTTAPYGFSWNSTQTANGIYSVFAKAYDAAGNVAQSATAIFSVYNDTQAPAVSINPVVSPTTDTTQTITGFVSDDVAVANVTVQVNGGIAAQATVSGNSWSYVLAGISNGNNLITVKASDTAGNVSQATASISLKKRSRVAAQ